MSEVMEPSLALATIAQFNPVPVGSRVTCDPVPENSDADYLVLLTTDNAPAFYDIVNSDWVRGGSLIDDDVNTVPLEGRFESFKLGDLNIIATRSATFHRRFLAATSVAKRLNLLEKAERIALFQAVLYGNSCDACLVDDELEEVEF